MQHVKTKQTYNLGTHFYMQPVIMIFYLQITAV